MTATKTAGKNETAAEATAAAEREKAEHGKAEREAKAAASLRPTRAHAGEGRVAVLALLRRSFLRARRRR